MLLDGRFYFLAVGLAGTFIILTASNPRNLAPSRKPERPEPNCKNLLGGSKSVLLLSGTHQQELSLACQAEQLSRGEEVTKAEASHSCSLLAFGA